MLKNIYYNKSDEILNIKFPEDLLVICPSPTETDAVREMLDSKIEVITIARWIGSVELEAGMIKVGKSELILRLASAWRNYFPTASENIFYNAFEFLTELRSFTLDVEIVSTILDKLDGDLKKSILIFWAVLESEKLVDEHLSYVLKSEIELTRPLLFFGFKHFSSVQIEMVKQLSQTQDIYFYIPAEVKSLSISTDWINWIDTEEIKVNLEKDKIDANVIYFSNKRLNFQIKDFVLNHKNFHFSFVGSNTGLYQTQEVLFQDQLFKQSVDLFEYSKKAIFEKIKKSNLVSSLELMDLMTKESSLYLANQDFLSLKVVNLIVAALEIYKGYSLEINPFAIGILETVVKLNTPRNFLIPLSDNLELKIIAFTEVKYLKKQTSIGLIISKELSPFKGSPSSYPDEILEILKSIGPIRRVGLDILFTKNELEDALRLKNVVLFIEDELLETDPGIRDLAKNFNFVKMENTIEYKNKSVQDVFKNSTQIKMQASKPFSASRLQTYFDCPRKYYVNFVDKVDDTPIEKAEISPADKGNLEHLIIESYISKQDYYNAELHRKLCKEKLNQHIETHKIKINFEEYNDSFFELIEYTQNGIKYILDILKNKPGAKVYFEYALPENEFNFKGYIDCLIIENNTVSIYDFKRSLNSVGSKKDLENFEKLQLWIYALALSESYGIHEVSYVNISEVEKSISIRIEDEVAAFKDKIKLITDAYSSDEVYSATPRKKDVCTYCPIARTCHKGVLND